MKAKTMKRFTCDALIRRAVQKRKAAAKDSELAAAVDLNEIHRRFWARIAGKE